MLRTLRFAAKLNFKIDSSIFLMLRWHSYFVMFLRIRWVSEAFHNGAFGTCITIEFGVWKQLFADIRPDLTFNALQKIQINVFKLVKPCIFLCGFIVAAIFRTLWFTKGVVPAEARAQAGLDVFKPHVQSFLALLKLLFVKYANPIAESKATANWSIGKRFRAGFDFLLLREKSGDDKEWGVGGMLTKKCQMTKSD